MEVFTAVMYAAFYTSSQQHRQGYQKQMQKYIHTHPHIPEYEAVLKVAMSLHSQCTTAAFAASFATGTS